MRWAAPLGAVHHLRGLRDQHGSVVVEHGVELGLRAGAHHDRRLIVAGFLQRLLKSLGHGQQRDQHSHDAGDTHDHDG